MPSRHLLPASPPLNQLRYSHRYLLPYVLTGVLSFTLFCFIIFVFFFYRRLSRKRTAPSDLKSTSHQNQRQCRRFSYSLLRNSTASFSTSNLLGHGGFGSVYKAVIPSSNEELAVKVMDLSGSLQGELEFHNELSLASSLNSPYVVSLIGFSSDRRKRTLVLVYELMENTSLQDALLDRKCEELMYWRKRFDIITDVAKGLEYLHHFCTPPVIHGDIKPSNILLNAYFNAKIGDFGLARMKTEDNVAEKKEGFAIGEDNGSILEEAESLVTGYEDSTTGVDRSPESFAVRVLGSDASPEIAVAVSQEMGVDKASVSEAGFDKFSVDSGKNIIDGGKKNSSRKDWWWKQENGGVYESGRIKDYVMEWIGSEIKKERPKSEWIASPSSVDNNIARSKSLTTEPKKKYRKKLEWWATLDEEAIQKKKKCRKPKEWWREEFCDELTKKKKKKRGLNSSNGGDSWWQKGEEIGQESMNKKTKRSRGSIDWWLDGFNGEIRNGRKNCQEWASGGVSSTPSMRGTVCYIAPECGGGGGSLLSEKCDVYSFGVLLLVVVSGRRPLQVTASPMSELERANLISWARHLAANGKLLDLLDSSIHSLDKDQALLCLTIALLCLQRSPAKRPSMKEIVGLLSGQAEPPHIPFEFSPSPPSNFPFKSSRKVR